MQTVSSQYQSAMDTGLSLRALPRVILEFNHNRYEDTVTASNTSGVAEWDAENFPIASIVKPNRPKTGLNKAIVGQARSSTTVNMSKYFTVTPDSKYKYWVSPTKSTTGGALASTNPAVVYGTNALTNKIVVTFETTWAKPTVYTIQITTDGNTWTTVASSPAINADGQVILYRASGGTWTTAINRDDPTNIRGVRVNVTTMNKVGARCALVEISARLEQDVSADIQSANVEKTLEEVSMVLPVGTISANSCSVTLDNSTGKYDIDNASSNFFEIADSNARVDLQYGVDTSAHGGVGFEYIRQGTFFVDVWSPDTENNTMTIECTDFAKFLQNEPCQKMLLINKTPMEIIIALLATAGYNNYKFVISENDSEPVLPYVWFDDSSTVWAAISSVCRASQGSAYVDEDGDVVYLSRRVLFDKKNLAADLALSAVKVGVVEPNIIGVQKQFEVEANKVQIKYSPKKAATFKDGKPKDDVLWRPDGTVSLRAARLTKAQTASNTELYIDPVKAKSWPYEGFVNIEGEIEYFRGKLYRYTNTSGATVYATVYNQAEKENIDLKKSSAAKAFTNAFTGRLMGIKRAQKGTKAAAHSIDLAGWSSVVAGDGRAPVARNSTMKLDKNWLTMTGPAGAVYNTWTQARRLATDGTYRVYGTSIRFANVGRKHAAAGIFMHLQNSHEDGYFVELKTSTFADKLKTGEVQIYRRYADGTKKRISPGNGQAFHIVPGVFVQLDVVYQPETRTFTAYLNGVYATSAKDTNTSPFTSGMWGTFVRGETVASFEYAYAGNTTAEPNPEKSRFEHKITGGYTSGMPYREVLRNSKNVELWVFEEFGPIVHELRQFNVVFDKFPALNSKLLMTNDYDADVIQKTSSAFDASFLISNAGRDTAILNGEDPTIFAGQTVNQTVLVYGQVVAQEEEKTVEVVDSEAVRARGEVLLEYQSDWIQTEAQAKEVGAFITENWSEPLDFVEVEWFVNPAVQIGDMVTLNYPAKNMTTTTHKYNVVGISTAIEIGLSGSLTLRRVR